MSDKVLTVSIAAYNVEKYIDECLSPFTRGNVADRIEVLIIDDGGTDKTKDLCRAYISKFPGTFKFIHKNNGGWGSTINKGLELASGKYFKQLDGDDHLFGKNLGKYLDRLENTDVDLVFNPTIEFDDTTGKVKGVTELIDHSVVGGNIDFFEAASAVPKFNMHCSTFRTQMLKDNGITVLENAFYSDADYFIKGLCFVNTVIVDDYPIYCYRTGEEGQSVSLTGLSKHYKDNYKVIDGLISYIDEAAIDDKRRSILRKYICDSIAFQYEALVRLKKINELKSFDKKVFGIYHYTEQEVGNRSMLQYRRNDFKYAYLLYSIKVKLRDSRMMRGFYSILAHRQ